MPPVTRTVVLATLLSLVVSLVVSAELPAGERDLSVTRHRRDRASSRYNPASSGTNPNRGRKRVRLDNSGLQSAQTQPQPQPQPRPQSQPQTFNIYDPFQVQQPEVRQPTTPVRSRVTLNRNRNTATRNSFDDQQQPTVSQPVRSRSRSRSRSRHQEINRNPQPVTENSRYVNTNRFPSRGGAQREIGRPEDQDRDYNPQVLKDLNRFYGAQTEKRKELFERKKSYCDYDDYGTDLSSSQEPPSHITVTHTLPLATNINNFLLPTVTSVQLLAVSDLKSTEVDNSPVIYANLRTVAGQPGYQEVLYDALRAQETVQVSFTTACFNGRQTSYSQADTSTIYSVETVTSTEAAALPHTQDINELLSKFLSLPPQPGPSLQVSRTEITSTILHSSTYVTKVTETESSEISITFRGKPIVTTLLDTSVKEITATEFSTETRVDTRLVTQTVNGPPPVENTQLLQLSQLAEADPSLENQLLLLQLSNLLPQQQPSLATPALPQLQASTTTYEVTHTSTYVTVLTEESSQVIPLTFRGKPIETTIVETNTREITATEYSTELVTHTQQAPVISPLQPDINGLPPDQAQLLGNILPDLLNIPQLAQFALYEDIANLQQTPRGLASDVQYEDIDSLLLDPELLEALQNSPEIGNIQQSESFYQEKILQTVEPKFSVTTIFKSGKNPGEFTRLISTIYFDKRKRREAITPQQIIRVEASRAVDLDMFNSRQTDQDFDTLLIQSGRNF